MILILGAAEKYEVPKYEMTPGCVKEEEYKPSTEYKKEEQKPKEEEYKPSTEYKKEEYKPKEEEYKPSTEYKKEEYKVPQYKKEAEPTEEEPYIKK